jgi:hypothetical protein
LTTRDWSPILCPVSIFEARSTYVGDRLYVDWRPVFVPTYVQIQIRQQQILDLDTMVKLSAKKKSESVKRISKEDESTERTQSSVTRLGEISPFGENPNNYLH